MKLWKAFATLAIVMTAVAGGLGACASRDIPFTTLEAKYGFADS